MEKYISVVKKSFATLNKFEICLLVSILCLTVIGFVLKGEVTVNTIIAAIAAILGVFCVVFGAKGSMANWIFGTIEAFLHIYICFCTHIYGDMIQRLVYNLPMQFIGWNKWKKRLRDDNSQTIHTRYMTWAQRFYTLIATAAGTALLGIFLIYFGPWFIDMLHTIVPDMEFATLKQNYDMPMQLWLRETFFNTSRGHIPLPWLGSNDALPLATRMETRLPWRPTRGSLTKPSYLVRNRTLGPPLENNPEISPVIER